MIEKETVVATGKWGAFVTHIANNRIEYIGLMIFFHLVGLTDKVIEQTNGVCF